MYTYLYGGTPMDARNFNYTKYNWNSPFLLLICLTDSPKFLQII